MRLFKRWRSRGWELPPEDSSKCLRLFCMIPLFVKGAIEGHLWLSSSLCRLLWLHASSLRTQFQRDLRLSEDRDHQDAESDKPASKFALKLTAYRQNRLGGPP